MKPSEYIRKGWCQGTPARDRNGNTVAFNDEQAVAWCLLGALFRAAHDNHTCDGQTDFSKWVAAVMCYYGPKCNFQKFSPQWNDDPKRTQADVLAFLQRRGL